MKAIVKSKAEPGIEILEMEIPGIKDDEILVKILAGSLCGSDVHIYEWTAGYEWITLPIVPGHEFAAEVVKTGAKITQVSPGDRITALPAMPCGECEACRSGNTGSCKRRKALGFNRNGAFAEYMVIKDGTEIFKIPDGVTNEAASLCEPLAIAMKAVDLSGIKPGETAAVLGPGPIGLLTVLLLKAAGAGHIIITGTGSDKKRLEIARQLGADSTLNVEEEQDLAGTIKKTAGPPDLVFEATGIPHTINQGLKLVKNGGKVMVIGIHADKARIDPIDLVRNSKSLVGVYGYNRIIWQRVLRLLSSGKINVDPIITHRIPFSEGKKGFELAINKTAAKVIFVPEKG